MAKPAAIKVALSQPDLDEKKLRLRVVREKDTLTSQVRSLKDARDAIETSDDFDELWDNVPV